MNRFTPRNIAIIVALISGLVAAFLVTITSSYSYNDINRIQILFVFTGVTTFTYLLVFGAIKIFIYNKVKSIYNSVHNLKISKDFTLEDVEMDGDIFKEINSDVQQWALSNRNEIEQLRKLEAYRKEFVGNVSHELKTPVFNIQGYIHTLLDGGLYDSSINMDYLKRATKSIDRMISIIEDLDSISQLESGELALYKEKFDLVQLVNEIFLSLEMKAAAKKITLQLAENYYKPMWVNADKNMIRQVFTNLLVNSIKYGRENGSSTVTLSTMYEHIQVEVKDTGIGIASHHLPRIFERFYRVDKGRSREHGGSGLGLAIVKHIIEAHGHSIDVRSTEGEGTIFTFTLTAA